MNNASEKKNVLTEELIDNLDLILDAIHDDLLISDSQGKVIFVNETFETSTVSTAKKQSAKRSISWKRKAISSRPSLRSC